MKQNELIEKSAEVICSYLSRIDAEEIFYKVEKLKQTDLDILFQSALHNEKYELCIALQRAAAKMAVY